MEGALAVVRGRAIMSAEAAEAFIRRGWPVLPLKGKLPLAGTHGVLDATLDVAAIQRWPPNVNIGIATGNGRVVLDIDQHGVDGSESLFELERRHERLPRTVSVTTPRGGQHFYFVTDAPIRCSVGKLGPGLDVRGEGGFVVAPPAIGYEWDVAREELELAPLPVWLERLLTDRSRACSRRPQAWGALVRDGVAEGSRNVRCAELCGHLLRRRVDPFVVLELLLAWNRVRSRPPLGDGEVARIVDSIAGRELGRWTS